MSCDVAADSHPHTPTNIDALALNIYRTQEVTNLQNCNVLFNRFLYFKNLDAADIQLKQQNSFICGKITH